jgi:hypothetical protein
MSSGSTVPDPDPELINPQNFNFAKPKLFFKNIGKYATTSTYIHVRIPFNFTTVFNTKQAIRNDIYTNAQTLRHNINNVCKLIKLKQAI